MTAVAWGASTHPGHVRRVNEDSFVAVPPVFIVADGMGGHDRGEVASGLVADRFRELAADAELDHDRVVDALQRAHRTIRRRRDPAGREMGTTLAAVVLVPGGSAPHWLMVNVGDSRVYRLAGGRLEQLSVDHSVVQELIESGELTVEGALTHPERHVITRAVGVGVDLVADFAVRDPEPGERFLLCSDGVHGQLRPEQIRDTLMEHADPQDAAASLVAAVLTGRAPDNLTAVVIDVVESDQPSDDRLDDDTSPRAEVAEAAGVEAPAEATPEPVADGVPAGDPPAGGSTDGGDEVLRVPTW